MNKNRWCCVDARTSCDHIQKFGLNIDFDLMDLPADKYLSAAQAWIQCRQGNLPANRFGYGKYRGLWSIRNRLLQDVATLNKDEVLLWDRWGLMEGVNDNYKKISALQLEQLDEIAAVIDTFQRSSELEPVIALAEEYL